MGRSTKGHGAAKAGKAKSVKPRNLAKRELDGREAGAVRGGGTNFQDISIPKYLDKASPKVS